jgi:hypothetical protein
MPSAAAPAAPIIPPAIAFPLVAAPAAPAPAPLVPVPDADPSEALPPWSGTDAGAPSFEAELVPAFVGPGASVLADEILPSEDAAAAWLAGEPSTAEPLAGPLAAELPEMAPPENGGAPLEAVASPLQAASATTSHSATAPPAARLPEAIPPDTLPPDAPPTSPGGALLLEFRMLMPSHDGCTLSCTTSRSASFCKRAREDGAAPRAVTELDARKRSLSEYSCRLIDPAARCGTVRTMQCTTSSRNAS